MESTAKIRAGRLPDKVMLGFWCPGLGFLDPKGRTIGCLLHPAQNMGQDLRGPTGYQQKCARESCSQARAFAKLAQESASSLAEMCEGMDSFAFSSTKNPLMNLLAFGPVVAAAAHELDLDGLEILHSLPWLNGLKPHMGWLLGLMAQKHGLGVLKQTDVIGKVHFITHQLFKRISPPPPISSGEYLHELCDEWEARFWKAVSRRMTARSAELIAWRTLLEELL